MFDGISKWGLICGKAWNYEEANVVCRHLGFSAAVMSFTVEQESGEFLIILVNCGENKPYTTLQQCTFSAWHGIHRYCHDYEAAAVTCSGKV